MVYITENSVAKAFFTLILKDSLLFVSRMSEGSEFHCLGSPVGSSSCQTAVVVLCDTFAVAHITSVLCQCKCQCF